MFTRINKGDYTYDYYHPSEVNQIEQKNSNQFNPYINNEGTTMAIAGEDYVIVAADKSSDLSTSSTKSNQTSFVL